MILAQASPLVRARVVGSGLFPNRPSGYTVVADINNPSSMSLAGFSVDTAGNGVTSRVATLPWTPTYGGPAGILKHHDGGLSGGQGSDQVTHTFASPPSAAYALLEGYLPVDAALSDNSNKFAAWGWGDTQGGKELLLSGRVSMDGEDPRAGDDCWRLSAESGFASGAAFFNGTVPFGYGVPHVIEMLVVNSTGGQANGVARLWVDGTLASETTTLEMPAGASLTQLKIEGINNGNHSPTASDPRLIALPDGTPHDADWWIARAYLAVPA